MANRGEWGEPYAALQILGEGKLYVADEDGNKNEKEWMDILELIRHESKDRIVRYSVEKPNVEVFVNSEHLATVAATGFAYFGKMLAEQIANGKGASFDVSNEIMDFLKEIELLHIKAKSIDKSDLFLSLKDPRASIVRENVGFSIKSEFGKNPTLFNTAKASAVVYKVNNMTEGLMETINSMVDDKNHVAVSERCNKLLSSGCKLEFAGFPIADRAKCVAFQENLEMINPCLVWIIEKMLWNHFFEHEKKTDLKDVMCSIVESNPCNLSRPEVKYEYMMKGFLYAAYCGMTASTLWDGKSQVNGGFIKVSANGEVLAYYALESDAFKTYLYNNCYLEFPSTGEGHGNYGKVYKEEGEYYFRLNFQIRYR